MFKQFPYITAEHAKAMASAIRNHDDITEHMLARLYDAALKSASGPLPDMEGIIPSKMNVSNQQHGTVVVGTATDEKSGFYVQLARTSGKNLLTVGQKWVMEQPNMQGNVATVLW